MAKALYITASGHISIVRPTGDKPRPGQPALKFQLVQLQHLVDGDIELIHRQVGLGWDTAVETSSKARYSMRILSGLTVKGELPTMDEAWKMAGECFQSLFSIHPDSIPGDDSGDYMQASLDNLQWLFNIGSPNNGEDESEFLKWLVDFVIDGQDYPEGGCDGDIRFDIFDYDKLCAFRESIRKA